MAKYITEFQQYNTNFKIVGNCNAITFVNNGGSIVYVNNYPLAASGGTVTIAGNAGEVDVTPYNVTIGASSGNVWVIRKIDQK